MVGSWQIHYISSCQIYKLRARDNVDFYWAMDLEEAFCMSNLLSKLVQSFSGMQDFGGIDDRRMPDIGQLESRQLMDAIPVAAMDSDESNRQIDVSESRTESAIIHAPLSSNGDSVPVSSGLPWILESEDAVNRVVPLYEHFTDANELSTSLRYELISTTGDDLLESVEIDSIGNLTLDFRRDAFGEADLLIRVTNASGQSIEEELKITLLPLNDRPTTTGLSDVTIEFGAYSTVVDLFAAFDDVEDADAALSYEVTQNSNPDLFSSVEIDQLAGTLTFFHAENTTGVSQITIRATDSAGLSVETTLADGDYPVYSLLWGGPNRAPDTDALGLGRINYVTSFAIFPFENGSYDYSTIDEARFRNYLHSDFVTDGLPLVIDIEQPEFDNTPEGRANWARVLQIAQEERPELPLGIYSFVPGFGGYWPIQQYSTAELFLEADVTNWFTAQIDTFLQRYEDWQATNAEFRDSSLGAEYDNRSIGDYLDVITPSLYAPYRYGYSGSFSHAAEFLVTTHPDSDRIEAASNAVADGLRVSFLSTDSQALPEGIEARTTYYTVQTAGTSFGISLTKDGAPIAFSGSGLGQIQIRFLDDDARNSIQNDPAVRAWDIYRDGIIREAAISEVETLVWLSPSFRGLGQDFLDPEFFRYQLEQTKDSADGILLWNPSSSAAELEQNQGWWEVLGEFMTSLQTPTQFSITISASSTLGAGAAFDGGGQYVVSDDSGSIQAPAGIVQFDGMGWERAAIERWGFHNFVADEIDDSPFEPASFSGQLATIAWTDLR